MSFLTVIAWFFGLSLLIAFAFIFFIFVIPSVPLLNGSTAIDSTKSNQYYIQKGKVVYVQNGNFFSLGAYEIEKADKQSFEVLADNIARDKNHLYFMKVILDEINPKEVELLDPYTYEGRTSYTIVKDKQSVYRFGKKLQGVDAQSFILIQSYYAHDKSHFYYEDQILEAFPASFHILNKDKEHHYLKVNEHVYYQGELLDISHVESFELLEEGFSKDESMLYYYGKGIEDIDVKSFVIINDLYQKDKNSVYYKTKPMKDSHPQSFEEVSDFFYKDINHVYYFGSTLRGLNASSFTKKQAKSLDDVNKYFLLHYSDDDAEFALRSEFKELNYTCFIYKNNLFKGGNLLVGADVNDVRFIDNEDVYLQSNHKTYAYSKEIQGVDIKSFTPLEGDFSRDKKHLYYREKKVIDINPDTFTYKEGIYAQDINEHLAQLIYPDDEGLREAF